MEIVLLAVALILVGIIILSADNTDWS